MSEYKADKLEVDVPSRLELANRELSNMLEKLVKAHDFRGILPVHVEEARKTLARYRIS